MENFNFGNFLFTIARALVDFGKNLSGIFSYSINPTNFYKVLKLVNIDTSNLPQEINFLSLISGVGVITILVFFVIKLVRG